MELDDVTAMKHSLKAGPFHSERVRTPGRCCRHSSYMEQYRESVSAGGRRDGGEGGDGERC